MLGEMGGIVMDNPQFWGREAMRDQSNMTPTPISAALTHSHMPSLPFLSFAYLLMSSTP